MDASQRQLRDKKTEDFRIVTMNDKSWLCRIEEGEFVEAHDCGDNYHLDDNSHWLKKWNIDQLIDLKISQGASFTVRKFTAEESEHFLYLQAKMLRAKVYALGYWENQIFSGFFEKK